MKSCHTCKISKPLSEFGLNKRSKDGLQHNCKPCKATYEAEYYKKTPKRQSAIKASNARMRETNRLKLWNLLIKSKCNTCGESDPLVLQFDHLGNKTHNIARMISASYGWPSIQREIDKCQILCANCHIRKTAKDFGWWKTLIDTPL